MVLDVEVSKYGFDLCLRKIVVDDSFVVFPNQTAYIDSSEPILKNEDNTIDTIWIQGPLSTMFSIETKYGLPQ